MLEKIIYLFTALLGFVNILFIGFRFKTNRNTNFYFIVFLFLSSIQFLAYSLSDVVYLFGYEKKIDCIFTNSAWPLLYLYFSKLATNPTPFKIKKLLHFIAPLLLVILFFNKIHFTNEAFLIGRKIGIILAFPLNAAYAIACYKLLKNRVWKQDSAVLVINPQQKILTQWSKILFTLFTLMSIRFLINIILYGSSVWYINDNNFLWVGALIWMMLYAKILNSPEFLFGYDELKNKIAEYDRHNVIFENIWVFDVATPITNIQDALLKEKIASNLKNYVLQIEHLALNTNMFFDDSFCTTFLAHKLNIPKSHMLYIFKYHTKTSFSNFKKLIRIRKTILLIDNGYLKINTLESLSLEAGFSSYSSFFKSFKYITGLSPMQYSKRE